jgi:hypothetical protein
MKLLKLEKKILTRKCSGDYPVKEAREKTSARVGTGRHATTSALPSFKFCLNSNTEQRRFGVNKVTGSRAMVRYALT